MPKCALDIKLEKEGKCYKTDEKIKGRVYVSVDKICQCEKLTIELFWRTHGLGNKDTGPKITLALFEGNWDPGTHHYDFEFTIPNSPRTYVGESVNIDWYLCARADIPWIFDPKIEVDFTVTPNINYRRDSASIFADFRTNKEYLSSFNDNKQYNFLPVISLGIFCLGLIVLTRAMFSMSLGGLVFGSLMLLGTFSTAKFFVKQHIAFRKLGVVGLEINQPNFYPGERLNFKLKFSPKADIQINHISAQLVLEETAISGSGTSGSRHKRFIEGTKKRFDGPFLFYSGGTFEKSGELQIADHSIHSFQSDNNSLLWYLNIAIDINQWPDFDKKESIIVLN